MPDQPNLDLLNGKYKNTLKAIYDAFYQEGFIEGQVEVRTQDLILVLERRFDVHDEALFDRIRSEERPDLLDQWFHDVTRLKNEAAVQALCARILNTPPSPR